MHKSQSLLKSPAESFKDFNQRLEAAVKEMLPSKAVLYVTSGAPLVVLEDDGGDPLASVRVVPLPAGNAAEAAKSQEILKRIATGNVRMHVLSGGDDYAFAIVLGFDQVEEKSATVETGAVQKKNEAGQSAGFVEGPRVSHRPHYGYRVVAGRLEVEPLEAAVIVAVLEARAAGARNGELIAAASSVDPLDGSAGRARVRRILCNATLYESGKILMDDGIVRTFPSLVIVGASHVHA